jgi:hypothetical protein
VAPKRRPTTPQIMGKKMFKKASANTVNIIWSFHYVIKTK